MTTISDNVQGSGFEPSDRSTALLTDKYELTMLQAALRDGSAHRQVACEVFARRLPNERRYGVVAGTERVLRAVRDFRFTAQQLAEMDFLDAETKEYLANYRFSGHIDGYREGELYFPNSPLLTVRGTFGAVSYTHLTLPTTPYV